MEMHVSSVSYRAHLQQHVSNGRRTLIGLIILTVINLGLLLTNGDTYLLFSASVPYYLTWLGKVMDNSISGAVWTENGVFTATGLIVGMMILAVYFLFWVLSKKNSAWLWAAVVLLCLDLLALMAVSLLVLEGFGSTLVDVLIHIVAIYQIGKAAASWKKLQNLPPETSYTVVNDDL